MPVEDLIYGWAEMENALPDYQEAEDYYEGEMDEVFANARIEAAIARTGEQYKFGLASIPVKTLRNRVKLRSVTAKNPAADEVISNVTKANRLTVQMPDAILQTLEYGDCYVQVWTVDDTETGPGLASRLLADAGVEVTVHGPKHVRMFYDDRTARRPVFLLKRWQTRQAGERVWRVDLYYPGVTEEWVSLPGRNLNEGDTWVRHVGPDQTEPVDIPTPTEGEIPWIHYRTGLPYGTPVHKMVYGCQNAVTKMLVTQLTTTDSHGWPQRWALAEAGAELDNAGDDPDWSDDTDASDDGSVQGGVSSGGRSGPGTLQRFTGTREVGQFAAADPTVFLDPVNLYIRLMAQLSFIPLHYFDPTGGTPSGESLKVADTPLKDSADTLVEILTGPVQEQWDLILRIAGQPVSDPVDVQWAPTQAASGLSDWEETRAKQDAGVPIPVTLIEAGYAPETVDNWDLPDHDANQFTGDASLTTWHRAPGPASDTKSLSG